MSTKTCKDTCSATFRFYMQFSSDSDVYMSQFRNIFSKLAPGIWPKSFGKNHLRYEAIP